MANTFGEQGDETNFRGQGTWNIYKSLLGNKADHFREQENMDSSTGGPQNSPLGKLNASKVPFHYRLICLKTDGWVANSVDLDHMPHSVPSDLGLHCLLRPVCPNTPYLACPKSLTILFYLLLKTDGWVANSVDPDQMPHTVASDLGLHCLLRPVCSNTKGYYGIFVADIMWKSLKTIQKAEKLLYHLFSSLRDFCETLRVVSHILLPIPCEIR